MWRALIFHDERFERGVRSMLRSGLVYINHGSGLIELVMEAMAYDNNWLFWGYTTSLRDCYLWHQVMFDHFEGLVPSFCRLRCYKVVVKVRNFLEAMQFRGAILAAPLARRDLVPLHGKVGIDERDYTDGIFNGFIYCDGPDDAFAKYKIVRELVDEQIPTGKDIPVIIKRSCTEFEKKHGATNTEYWQRMSDDERNLQNLIEDIFATVQGSAVQPDWLINRTIAKMVRWANTVGDKSWIDYFDGGKDFLTMKAVTYHEQFLEQEANMKAKALTQNGKTKQIKQK